MSVALALVTCPADAADALADFIVRTGAAACVNIVPGVRSVYRWNDAVCRDDEVLLLIKHPSGSFEELREAVMSRHPHELPEIVAIDLDRGYPPYLRWVLDSCR